MYSVTGSFSALLPPLPDFCTRAPDLLLGARMAHRPTLSAELRRNLTPF